MRTEQLVYLESVVRLGSFRGAARVLGVSQPTLTEQVRRLEEELDVNLLTRGHSGVTLTTAAEQLLPYIRRVLEDSRSLQEEASALSTLRSGSVRIGGTPTLNSELLMSAILEYRRLHPNVRFEVTEGGSGRLVESVIAGDLDVALVMSIEDLSDNELLIARKLRTDDVVLCVPRTHRLAAARGVRLAEVKDEPWVVFGADFMLRHLLDKLIAGMKLNIVYNALGSSTIVHMVARGIGITLTTTLAIDNADALDRQRVVALPLLGQQTPQVYAYLIRRRGVWPTPASRELERLIMQATEGTVGVPTVSTPLTATAT